MSTHRTQMIETAADALARGARRGDVVALLIKSGFSDPEARQVVNTLAGNAPEPEKFVPGVLVLAGGVALILFAAYALSAAEGGGTRGAVKLGAFGGSLVLAGGGMIAKAL